MVNYFTREKKKKKRQVATVTRRMAKKKFKEETTVFVLRYRYLSHINKPKANLFCQPISARTRFGGKNAKNCANTNGTCFFFSFFLFSKTELVV